MPQRPKTPDLSQTHRQWARTPLGRRCVVTGDAPTWELGAFAFLVALHPLFERLVLGFRRLDVDARDLDFNSLEPMPGWFEADPARTWASAFAGDPAFTLFSFTSQRGLDPRCRLAELDPARLAWVIDLGTGENGWNLEGEVGGKNNRTTSQKKIPPGVHRHREGPRDVCDLGRPLGREGRANRDAV